MLLLQPRSVQVACVQEAANTFEKQPSAIDVTVAYNLPGLCLNCTEICKMYLSSEHILL